jgi:hypothetical protein
MTDQTGFSVDAIKDLARSMAVAYQNAPQENTSTDAILSAEKALHAALEAQAAEIRDNDIFIEHWEGEHSKLCEALGLRSEHRDLILTRVVSLIAERDQLRSQLAPEDSDTDQVHLGSLMENPSQPAPSVEDVMDAKRYRAICDSDEWTDAIIAAFDCSGKVLIDVAVDDAMRKGLL